MTARKSMGRCRARVVLALAAVLAPVGLAILTPVRAAAAGTSKIDPPTVKPAPAPGTFGIAQVALINAQIRQSWQDHKLEPVAPATDQQWCRRVYLDVLGRVPSVAELEKFVGEKKPDTRPDKKLLLVNRLLGDEYVAEYARNWTTLWTNILIGRKGGTEKKTLVSRPGLQQSLRRALERNVSYDKLVYDLVSAQGISAPGEKGFNGYVNFLAGNMQDRGIEATAKTAQIFLGVQVRCTQCHNHPFNEWKQNQFWELNAFFRQTQVKPHTGRNAKNKKQVDYVELLNQDFKGEDNQPDQAALFYELRNGKLEVAFPVFVDGTKLSSPSGYLRNVDRRTELAQLIRRSDALPQSLVNRLWGHFLGYGFTKPIDDMGPHNSPTHPELLEQLAKQFRDHSFDLKELMRWIVLSEPYGLSSVAGEPADDPSRGEKPMFSHFYLRQMQVEELYESLLVATEAQKSKASLEEQEELKHKWLDQFTLTFGTDENDEATTFNGTIPQALMMMNGDLTRRAISIDKGGFLQRIATNAGLANAAKINHLFLAALARRPNPAEIRDANQLLLLRQGNAAAALQDVWWALLNSNEFILNH